MAFYNIFINLLTQMGFFNVIIPFLLVYSIIYGLLAKYKIIGDPYKSDAEGKATRSLISMIAAAIGFFVVAAANVVLEMLTLIPYFVLFILTIFLLLLAIAPFITSGGEIKIEGKTRNILLAASIIAFFLITMFSLGLFNYLAGVSSYFSSGYTIQIVETLLVLGILFGIVYWIVKVPAKEEKSSQSK
ncbi:MAG: hypothetical protein ACP5GJ_00130 [Nanopusillaceae archaeon]